MNNELYLEKYLKYKNKYLNFIQDGGNGNNVVLYLCFNPKKTETALNTLSNDFNMFNSNDINNNLHVGAYKYNFGNVMELVIALGSEKKLKKPQKLASKLYIQHPFSIIDILSKNYLINITKELEETINSYKEPPATNEEKDKTVSDINIQISSVLMFKENKQNMHLISHYTINDGEIKEQDIPEYKSVGFSIVATSASASKSGLLNMFH